MLCNMKVFCNSVLSYAIKNILSVVFIHAKLTIIDKTIVATVNIIFSFLPFFNWFLFIN